MVKLKNKSGNYISIGPAVAPGKAFPGIGQNGGRQIKYLMIHTTAGNQNRLPIDTAAFFLDPGSYGWDEKDQEYKWSGGRWWNQVGYHWMIEPTGYATRCAPDSVETNGAGPINPVTIHINWIGGHKYLDMTKQQATTLKYLVTNYLTKYESKGTILKCLGHHQQAAKDCPWFWVPTFIRGLNSKVDMEKYIVKGFSKTQNEGMVEDLRSERCLSKKASSSSMKSYQEAARKIIKNEELPKWNK